MAKRLKNYPLISVIDPVVWPYDILLCIGSTGIEIVDHIQGKLGYKLDVEELATFKSEKFRGVGRALQLKNNSVVLWLKYPPKCPETISTLAHEAMHAAHYVLDTAGMKLTDDSEEAYSYLIGFITREALIAWNKKR